MSKEYIERSEVLEKCGWYNTVSGKSICAVRKDELAAIPVADVVEVRHGRWLKTEEPLGWHEVDCIECSACHDSWIADEDYGLDFADFWKYCPTCGARMDGE